MVQAKANLEDGKYFSQPKLLFFCGADTERKYFDGRTSIFYLKPSPCFHPLEIMGFLYLKAQSRFALDVYRKWAVRMTQIQID
jgi:hypothetical protein